jgi:hypothetical protein
MDTEGKIKSEYLKVRLIYGDGIIAAYISA